MAVVISDAGPLIALAQVNALDLIYNLFTQVCVPQAVADECLAKAGNDAEIIRQALSDDWLSVVDVTLEHGFPQSLGQGESEVIQLALTSEQALLIIDDQLARRYAARLKLNFIGTAKILTLAERKGLLVDAKAVLGLMIENGYRISPKFLG